MYLFCEFAFESEQVMSFHSSLSKLWHCEFSFESEQVMTYHEFLLVLLSISWLSVRGNVSQSPTELGRSIEDNVPVLQGILWLSFHLGKHLFSYLQNIIDWLFKNLIHIDTLETIVQWQWKWLFYIA